MRYLPKSDQERAEMLQALGLASAGELFASLPESIRLKGPLDIPEAYSEPAILEYFRQRGAENAGDYLSLLGAGCYHHFQPVVIDALISRGEFLTAYTPYQAEISQGTLQAIFEFQTLLCQLTGQEVANASMYDGSTALAEAVLMALRIKRHRTRVVVARSIHPEYRAVLTTYLGGQEIDLVEVPCDSTGQIDTAALGKALDDNTAVVAIQSPNFFGCLEDVKALAELTHKQGALLVTTITEPVSLGLLRPPTEADIVALEAQGFGLDVSYGGPYAGVIATKQQFVRQIPGRLTGQTTDADGQRGFVLTLSTREQHIRREKATSNICTNQALCALAVTIFLTVYGKQGLRELAEQNLAKAAYLCGELEKIAGVERLYPAPFFNEFAVSLKRDAGEVLAALQKEKILGGVALSRWYPEHKNALLLCATETVKKEGLDRFAAAFGRAMGS